MYTRLGLSELYSGQTVIVKVELKHLAIIFPLRSILSSISIAKRSTLKLLAVIL